MEENISKEPSVSGAWLKVKGRWGFRVACKIGQKTNLIL